MIQKLWRNLRSVLGRDRVEGDLNRELDFHLTMEIDRRIKGGLPPEEARRQVLRDFGAVDRVKEEVRDARGITFWDTLNQDIRYGVRSLARNPGFTIVAILTLALGIGANTAIFSVINGVLLEPLPYAEGERLVLLRQSAPLRGQDSVGISIKEVMEYRDELRTFDDLVEYHSMSFTLLNRGEPDQVATGVVSANFFDVLGVTPILGRTFHDKDDDLGAEAVLILSHAYWRQRFGADTAIVGQVFEMNDRPHTVVGVLPPLPQYPRENDVYMPTSACPFRARGEENMHQNRRAFAALLAFGRVKPGVSQAAIDADVDKVCGRFTQDYPEVYQPEQSGFTTQAIGLHTQLTQEARPLLFLLVGATGLVLLIGCANVANLALARTMRRERELAVRAALGAGRLRLLRQLLTESTLVGLAGGVLGLLFAWLSLDMLSTFIGRFTPWTGQIRIDGGVLVFTLVVSAATGLLFGCMPAFAARNNLVGSLKEGGLHAGESAGRQRLRKLLIVGQVTVSFVLLVGAGLLLASFYRLSQVDAGYRAEQVLSADVFGNFTKYQGAEDLLKLYEPLLDRLAQLPGVQAAAITNAVPLSNIAPFPRPIEIEGRAESSDRQVNADRNVASEDYFVALGIPLLRGRQFVRLDHQEAPRVAIINQSMARLWNDADPIGWRFSAPDPASGERVWYTVVGIVADVRQYGLDQEASAQYYVPLRQSPGIGGRVLLRAQGDTAQLASALKGAVWSIDSEQAVENIQTLQTLRSERLASPRLTALLLTLFAGLALVITVAGLAGVIATAVTQRTHEFGVRMALGASRASVLTMVVGQGLLLVMVGLGLGVGAALAVGRVLSTQLFATDPTDPIAFLSVAFVFLAAGLVACLGPARRATSIDPIVALRTE